MEYKVEMKIKDYGVIKLLIENNDAPITVENFINLVKENHYTNSTFHRVIDGFMIQGGIIEVKSEEIKGEFLSNGVKNSLKHERGIISMARTNIPNSATSQFFIMHKNAPHLDGNYASFGKVIEGIDVVDKIASVDTDMYDKPLSDVVIEYIKVID